MKHDSPLRYPGGKATLAEFLSRTIEANDLTGCSYFEPYAGGAGAALRLLRKRCVSELWLNDLDRWIFACWSAVLYNSERFVEGIQSVPLTVAEWRRQKQIYLQADFSKSFEVGFSTFYLNRCNRSGILHGAGPIGGYAQTGEWKIGARFNRKNLASRVQAVARQRDQIHIYNLDALEFLRMHVTRERRQKRVFTYLDPPYYLNGNRLYMSSYSDPEHQSLARYIKRQHDLKWAMSYDDHYFIRKLYAGFVISDLPIQYSVNRRQRTEELMITPSHVRLPDTISSRNVCESVVDSY